MAASGGLLRAHRRRITRAMPGEHDMDLAEEQTGATHAAAVPGDAAMTATALAPCSAVRRLAGRLLHTLWAWLPEGHSLPEDVWQRRHRGILLLLWLQAFGLVGMAVVAGYGVNHGIGDAFPVAAAAGAAQWLPLRRRWRACLASLGLITVAVVVVHLSRGNIESHFFFVMLPVIILYQDWLPFLLAIGYVVLHHGVMGVLVPGSVYDHPDAWAHPWKWAAIHGGFVLAASASSIVIWRQGERARARTDLILQAVGEGIFGLDPWGVIAFVNPAAAQLLGWAADQLVGRRGELVLEDASAGITL
jgi:PAS domain-containing protein